MSAPPYAPPSVEEAKQALLVDDPAEPPRDWREWIAQHPGRAVAIAAGAGLALAVFPRLRRVAFPIALAVIQRVL